MLQVRKLAFLLLLAVQLFPSCKSPQEGTLIRLSPDELFIKTQPNKTVSISVKCTSPYELKGLTIISHIEGVVAKHELDTLISGKSFFLDFNYNVPVFYDTTNVVLEFILQDTQGGLVNDMKVLEVDCNESKLVETAGHEIFSRFSGKPNAYDLLNGVPLFSANADSSIMNIEDTSNTNQLLRQWISPSGASFVRFDGFDYANATNLSIIEGFNAGVKLSVLNNLSEGDIIIASVKDSKKAEHLVCIKIINIIDSDGADWDRYIFNIKR